MTIFEALVSISQTAMRARGQWCEMAIDETLRCDIRSMVSDVAKIIGEGVNDDLIDMAIDELERRACVND